jgi:hypothetical protein
MAMKMWKAFHKVTFPMIADPGSWLRNWGWNKVSFPII